MRIIFCCFPTDKKNVDPDYQDEYISTKENNFDISLISFEDIIEGNIKSALKTIPKYQEVEKSIYRGWMLSPLKYKLLYDSLKERNILLINNPEEYKNCHYFPESYKIIKNNSPKSLWFKLNNKTPDFNLIINDLKVFKGKPLIIKDYVKSQKHKWFDACYISSSTNEGEIKRVTKNFIDFQGDNFEEGLVYREFLEFESIGNHAKSNMPITHEYRIFFLNGKLLAAFKYWSDGEYQLKSLEEDISIKELENFKSLAKEIKSNFFSMDIAKSTSKEWYIVELGEGQVAGLPSDNDSKEFYSKLKTLVL